ncbi:hypothetical protein Y032_0545g3249 [Ancylostoma ceylanicum]|uniref:Uncharacterized protein n=1 Tax=Ancylostoma ceylanicum TaxID=53326 RepID=A0A016WR67_9BILA|nr:hypothetical protein Y032_0545g3249 [Ancylostoma ceylanicum]
MASMASLQYVSSNSIHLPHPSLENLPIFPATARTFEGCRRDAHMNRPVTAQQRTSSHAALRIISECYIS